jgi:hypothetical protein
MVMVALVEVMVVVVVVVVKEIVAVEAAVVVVVVILVKMMEWIVVGVNTWKLVHRGSEGRLKK